MKNALRMVSCFALLGGFLASCGSTAASESSDSSSSSSDQIVLPDEVTGMTVDDFTNVRAKSTGLLNEPISVFEPANAASLSSVLQGKSLPTVTILTVDDELNVVFGDGSKGEDFFTVYLTLLYKVGTIPGIKIESQRALDLYLAGIRSNTLIKDSYLVSSDPEILKRASEDTFAKTFYLAFDASPYDLRTDDDCYAVSALSTIASADTVILNEESANLEDTVEWFNARFKSTWVKAQTHLARALCSGAYGVMTQDASGLDALYAKMDKAGRTRKQFLSAHRGLTILGKYNQNSIPAIVDAYKVGATHVEIDLQITRDNVIVVCHDDSPGYFSDDCPSKADRFIDYDWDEMKDYRLNDNGVDVGNKIPTLEEALLAAKGTDLVFMLEFKIDWCSDKALAKEPLQYVNEIVRKTGMEKQVIGITYYPFYAMEARQYSPWMPIASIGHGDKYYMEYVGPSDPEGMTDYLRKYQWGCDYSLETMLLANSYKLEARGYPINSYTYEDQSHFSNASNIVTTDVAETSQEVVARLAPEPYIYLNSIDDTKTLSSCPAVTYGGTSKEAEATFILLEGDVATDQYLTGTFYYYDESLSHGLYSQAVTIGNGDLGASKDYQRQYEEKGSLVVPDSLRQSVYGA